jgi:hypothetical protein
MSVETIIWIAYGVIALVFGYWCGYTTWHHGASDIPRNSAGWSFNMMILDGVAWPIIAFVVALGWVFSRGFWKTVGRVIFRG